MKKGNNSKSTYSAILKYIFFVYPITHFGVIVLFTSNFQTVNTFRPLFQNVYEIYYKFKHQICSVTLYKFDEKRAITPRWVIRFT
jgi:hypothetical protein